MQDAAAHLVALFGLRVWSFDPSATLRSGTPHLEAGLQGRRLGWASDGGPTDGDIAGLTIGVVALFTLLGALAWLLTRWWRSEWR